MYKRRPRRRSAAIYVQHINQRLKRGPLKMAILRVGYALLAIHIRDRTRGTLVKTFHYEYHAR